MYSGNLKLSYKVNDKAQFCFGITVIIRTMDYRQRVCTLHISSNVGSYLLGKYAFSQRILSNGCGYDFGNIKTQAYSDWFSSPVVSNNDTTYQYLKRADDINRSFSNVSWSLGYNYNDEKWSFKANVGKSFRMPSAKELAANGVNYHNFSYEVGNSELSPEVSYQLDAGLEYTSKKFVIGVSPFLNY